MAFNCTKYEQSNRFINTVVRISDLVGQDYKSRGTTRTEVITQTNANITVPVRPEGTIVLYREDGTTVISRNPPDVLNISDH